MRSLLVMLLVALSACDQAAPLDAPGPSSKSAIPGVLWEGDSIVSTGLPLDVDLLDPRLVNIVLEHALNSGCLESRTIHEASDLSRTMFKRGPLPEGFIPVVSGVEFIDWERDQTDGLEPGEVCLLVTYEPWGSGLVDPSTWSDLTVDFSDVGGPTVPDGTEYTGLVNSGNQYKVDRSGKALRIRYAGTYFRMMCR